MLGRKIKAKRIELGISQKKLAEMTDLTPGFLSQIERDLAEPSVTSLRKISRALNVPVFYFLMEDDDQKAVVKKDQRRKLNFHNSHMTYELLCPDLNRQMEMFMGELEPGAMTCEEPLPHPGEEVTYVLKGKMWIRIGEDEYSLEEGDTIYYQGSIPHQIKNVGSEMMVFISTITPPLF
ncbi:helix-turn-helix domain-containing protein [Pseudodesulfovibrio piezophilus]|uniref:Transcriptional regulator, MerR family n=1 Tax=Pseudodesulfovibrio piezophilus (strain DSM 21447 / JCM 15486 / C1TLV30) TaxID=1322246 RepID=M1WPK9_PSEP2|nr:XRE family transcriptional regulator [Pseudodesulfovibrio piezophilus]CCH48419.1 Transcriptional regulator, MerR family [Pseudodesulfovibrio piezophilus C1TLV30]